MPVFISHKREDKPQALKIAGYLKAQGIVCYIDVLDPELQTTDDITNTLMKRVKQCSHLMVVVSGNTQKSWWVSFEIGVASELKRRITSFEVQYTQLPEFLEKWPILKTNEDFALFVQLYKKDVSIKDSNISIEEATIFDSVSTSIYSSEDFHKQLKSLVKSDTQFLG